MTKRARALGGSALLLCATAACGEGGEGAIDAWCNTPGRENLLLFYALWLGVAGAIVVGARRLHRLKAWDLRDHPSAPSAGAMVWTIPVLFLVAGLVLSWALYGADGCAPEQRTRNLWFLCAGITAACTFCLGGLAGANRWYSRRRS